MSTVRDLLREPLVHFVGIGLLVLAIDLARGAPEVETEAPIVLDAEALELQITDELGRPPTPEERAAAHANWVRTEVYVREARRLGLSDNDEIIRTRMAERAETLLKAGELGDAERAWATARDRYVIEGWP